MNLNVVAITGNLTKDPDLRSTQGGTSVCSLRVAVNTRRKQGDEWVDKPNYFDVTVWGRQGEMCAEHLHKGRPVGVQGRLEWREWEAKDGTKRQSVEIIADSVQFLGSKSDGDGGGQTSGGGDAPADTSGLPDTGSATPPDDDIPFARPEQREPFEERERRSQRGPRRPPALL